MVKNRNPNWITDLWVFLFFRKKWSSASTVIMYVQMWSPTWKFTWSGDIHHLMNSNFGVTNVDSMLPRFVIWSNTRSSTGVGQNWSSTANNVVLLLIVRADCEDIYWFTTNYGHIGVRYALIRLLRKSMWCDTFALSTRWLLVHL